MSQESSSGSVSAARIALLAEKLNLRGMEAAPPPISPPISDACLHQDAPFRQALLTPQPLCQPTPALTNLCTHTKAGRSIAQQQVAGNDLSLPRLVMASVRFCSRRPVGTNTRASATCLNQNSASIPQRRHISFCTCCCMLACTPGAT